MGSKREVLLISLLAAAWRVLEGDDSGLGLLWVASRVMDQLSVVAHQHQHQR